MIIEITVLIAIIGCFIGLAGWLSGRDKKIASDSEWKGRVDAKLDLAIGIRQEVEDVKEVQKEHGERIAAVEQSTKSAHHRLDNITEKK